MEFLLGRLSRKTCLVYFDDVKNMERPSLKFELSVWTVHLKKVKYLATLLVFSESVSMNPEQFQARLIEKYAAL